MSANVTVLTDETFAAEVLQSDTPVVVDFWASWCGPCQMMIPVFDAVAGETEGVKFCKMNVDECQETAGKYGIMSIPAFKIFKGGEIAGEILGAMDKAAFAAEVAKQTA